MSEMGKIERPEGYYSRQARAQRSAASKRRRQESAARREQEAQERAARAAIIDRKLGPVKAFAQRRLQDLAASRAAMEDEKRSADAKLGRSNKPRLLSKKAQRRARNKAKPERLAEKWKHKNGAPETLEHASRTRQGALARLCAAGDIDAEQLGWALEIAEVAEQIQADVAVRTASLETRVDCGESRRNGSAEGIRRVRFHVAYTNWREQIPQPRAAILDMIIGETIPFSTAARRYRIGRDRAKRLLIGAIDLWPECVDAAARRIDRDTLDAYEEALR